MDYNTINNAFNEAESMLRSADSCTGRAVCFAAGRLRRLHLDTGTLRELKRELQNFNAKRGKWLPH